MEATEQATQERETRVIEGVTEAEPGREGRASARRRTEAVEEADRDSAVRVKNREGEQGQSAPAREREAEERPSDSVARFQEARRKQSQSSWRAGDHRAGRRGERGWSERVVEDS